MNKVDIMTKHINRSCLQNGDITEHYAETMEEAIKNLISFHSSDCPCDTDNYLEHIQGECLLWEIVKLLGEGKTKEASEEICSSYEWELKEVEAN